MSYAALSDDFYVNLSLGTEMDLPTNRETVLHFFERVQKQFPQLKNFFSREKGDFVLEEDKDQGGYRWVAIEARRLSAGQVNPTSIDDALKLHEFVLEQSPYFLSVSPLDCEAIDLLYGFDFTYQGNHNQLVADTLGVSPALDRLIGAPGVKVVHCEPSLTLALDEECRWQCRVSVETRTNAYSIRAREFPEEQLSVYVTARRYGSLDANMTYGQVLTQLREYCETLCDNYVVPQIVRPLQHAIAAR